MMAKPAVNQAQLLAPSSAIPSNPLLMRQHQERLSIPSTFPANSRPAGPEGHLIHLGIRPLRAIGGEYEHTMMTHPPTRWHHSFI